MLRVKDFNTVYGYFFALGVVLQPCTDSADMRNNHTR